MTGAVVQGQEELKSEKIVSFYSRSRRIINNECINLSKQLKLLATHNWFSELTSPEGMGQLSFLLRLFAVFVDQLDFLQVMFGNVASQLYELE